MVGLPPLIERRFRMGWEAETAGLPRFVSFIAVALGCFDIIRGVANTAFAGYVAGEIAGLDLDGPTGRDQLVLMIAFGASNFITAAALIYLGLRDRLGALVILFIIPLAYVMGHVGLRFWETDLVGQGVFPGAPIMQIYLGLCVATFVAALAMHWRRRATPLAPT